MVAIHKMQTILASDCLILSQTDDIVRADYPAATSIHEQTFAMDLSSSSSGSSSSSSEDLSRSFRGSLLPLVFGLPFAPELLDDESGVSTEGPRNRVSGALSQIILTFWVNFAYSGDPNRPHEVQSLFPRQIEVVKGNFAPRHTWEPYDLRKQRYLEIDLIPRMYSHYRVHSMSIWLSLVPKLHNAGSNNIFPQHNAFLDHDDPSLYTGVVRPNSFSHGYQVNREFLSSGTSPAPPSTTCLPVNSRGQIITDEGSLVEHHHQLRGDSSGDSGPFVRWQPQSDQAYMYLSIAMGTLLLGINIWFLLLLFFCRSRLTCCGPEVTGASPSSGGGGLASSSTNSGSLKERTMGEKEFSCETELLRLDNESTNNSRQNERDHHYNGSHRSSGYGGGGGNGSSRRASASHSRNSSTCSNTFDSSGGRKKSLEQLEQQLLQSELLLQAPAAYDLQQQQQQHGKRSSQEIYTLNRSGSNKTGGQHSSNCVHRSDAKHLTSTLPSSSKMVAMNSRSSRDASGSVVGPSGTLGRRLRIVSPERTPTNNRPPTDLRFSLNLEEQALIQQQQQQQAAFRKQEKLGKGMPPLLTTAGGGAASSASDSSTTSSNSTVASSAASIVSVLRPTQLLSHSNSRTNNSSSNAAAPTKSQPLPKMTTFSPVAASAVAVSTASEDPPRVFSPAASTGSSSGGSQATVASVPPPTAPVVSFGGEIILK